MTVYVIQNPVPTPEDMAAILGMSQERVAMLRKIMNEPVRTKSVRQASSKGVLTRKSIGKAISSRSKRVG